MFTRIPAAAARLLAASTLLIGGAALADPSESYKATGHSAFAEILLAGYDASGDGALSQSEFGVAMRDLAPEKAAEIDFYAIDLDGSGGLDRAELSAWQDDTIEGIAAGEQGGN